MDSPFYISGQAEYDIELEVCWAIMTSSPRRRDSLVLLLLLLISSWGTSVSGPGNTLNNAIQQKGSLHFTNVGCGWGPGSGRNSMGPGGSFISFYHGV